MNLDIAYRNALLLGLKIQISPLAMNLKFPRKKQITKPYQETLQENVEKI